MDRDTNLSIFDSIADHACGILRALKTEGTDRDRITNNHYSTKNLIRRLLSLAWQFRADCVWSVVLSLLLLLLGIVGLKLLGLVIDIIRRALDHSLPPSVYPFGWHPPPDWSALQTVTAIAVTIMVLAL